MLVCILQVQGQEKLRSEDLAAPLTPSYVNPAVYALRGIVYRRTAALLELSVSVSLWSV